MLIVHHKIMRKIVYPPVHVPYSNFMTACCTSSIVLRPRQLIVQCAEATARKYFIYYVATSYDNYALAVCTYKSEILSNNKNIHLMRLHHAHAAPHLQFGQLDKQ